MPEKASILIFVLVLPWQVRRTDLIVDLITKGCSKFGTAFRRNLEAAGHSVHQFDITNRVIELANSTLVQDQKPARP